VEHLVALPQYDVLAYLIVGLAAIAACDLIYSKRIFFRGDWDIKALVSAPPSSSQPVLPATSSQCSQLWLSKVKSFDLG
jgi:hypothetical protein